MAFKHWGLLAVLSLAVRPSLQQNDPIQNFCRRWGHSTAHVDSRLYIDGGMVASAPFTANNTNPWLLFSDLNTSVGVASMPQQYANLSKPSNIPSVSGGYTWSDNTNKCFYQVGGEFPNSVSLTTFSMWTYDVLLNQWNATETNSPYSIQRVSYGAGTQVETQGLGFLFGGWINNKTTSNWTGPPVATTGLLQFDMTSGALRNTSGPDNVGRAEGQLVYLPISDSGVLVYFGGIEDAYHNGTVSPANMSTIHIYDMASSKWYIQTATGNVPHSRRQFCADITWADDQSSYNVYLYGGFGFDGTPAFDDVYILSMPSFTWIKAFPTDGSDSKPATAGHGGCSANTINRAQMLIIGGWFPLFNDCDTPGGQGQHNMVLGYNGGEHKLWDKYDPQLTNYVVPSPITSVIGGGATGGATKTAPATWGHPDLVTYFTLKPTFSARVATRLLPSATGTLSGGDSSDTDAGAIAGGVVGGLAALIGVLALVIFCLRRRKKALKVQEIHPFSPPPPPVELAATPVPQEMAAFSEASKYVQLHEQADSIALSNYPGHAQHHSPSGSHDYDPSYPAQSPPSYGHPSPYGSPTQSAFNHSPYNAHNSPPATWNQQLAYPQSAATAQGRCSYPAPTTPQLSHNDVIQQQVPVYYPGPNNPPSHSSHSSHSPRSASYFSDHRGSQTGTPYSGEGQSHSRTTSAINTPSQFYAQPVLSNSPRLEEASTYDPQDNRPLHGRFMEDRHL